jgi:FMN hydrolase / 5-amino-6-(5-phospho-D-ribitylamino)uracil phosphatase
LFRHIKIIAFDLDDTLWPCMPVIQQAEATLFQWLSKHYPRITQDVDQVGMVNKRLVFTDKNPELAADLTELRKQFLHELAQAAGYQPIEVSHQGFEIFFHARQQVSFYNDVFPVFERLIRRYRLGSISNGNACVKSVGLSEWFDHSISAPEIKAAKPDLIVYQALAECFEVEMHEILYVGDNPLLDVIGAIDAGFQAVWINRDETIWPEHLAQPQFSVSNLHELDQILLENSGF